MPFSLRLLLYMQGNSGDRRSTQKNPIKFRYNLQFSSMWLGSVDSLYMCSAQKTNQNALGNWMQQEWWYAFVCDNLTMRHSDTTWKGESTARISNRSKDNIQSIFASCYSVIKLLLLSTLGQYCRPVQRIITINSTTSCTTVTFLLN